MSGPRKTRSGTTVDDLYLVLRERIIDGTYGPGNRMSQEELAAELRVSRTPLREALRRLEADGFLVSNANRGMQVAPVANADTEQHYATRLLIEPPTMAAIVGDISDDEISAMNQALDAMTRFAGRSREFQEAHRRFHDVALSRYPAFLADLTHRLHIMIYRHQRVYLSLPRTPDDFVQTDALFLAAIRRRDGAEVRQLLEFHLLDAAVGLVLDFDPDHRFDSLLTALRGNGIEIEHDANSRIPRPATVTWTRRDAASMPAITTANLAYEPTRDLRTA